jgi:predicted DNA binding protein/PAS domain-containing protein
MLDEGLLHVCLLASAALVAAGLAITAWRNREDQGARPLAWAMTAVTFWTATEVLALSEAGASHLVWERVQWLAIAVVPLFFFLFIASFTGYDWVLSRRLLPAFFVIPAVTVLLTWTNPAHQLMWSDPVTHQTGGVVTLSQQFGPWFWVYFVYAYTLLLVGFVLLLRLVTVSEYLYLDQTVLIVVGILAPLAGNAISVFELAPLPGLDLTPYGFTITGIAFGNALFRYSLFDLLPATRRLGQQAALVDLNDGVVIVDTDRKILYLNPAAGEILNCDPEEALGDDVERFVDTRAMNLEATDRLAELVLDGRTYEVETAPIFDRQSKQVGHTVLLYDVTERTRREQELRTQRDRLQRLERINTAVREVNKALVSATTLEELQRRVVDTLATPGLYDDVWLSTTASDGPPVRMSAGDESPEVAESESLPPGIKGADDLASAEQRLPARQGSGTDRNWVTVALVYRRTVYGALALRTDRETGFDDRELEVLDELGETIGHALTALERTQLLVADTHVEIDIESTDSDSLLVGLSEGSDTEWGLTGLVPAPGGDLVAYLRSDADCTTVEEVASHSGVTEVRELATDGGTTFEVRASSGTLCHPLVSYGANVKSATATDGCCRLVVELSPDANVRAVVERVQERFPDTELAAKREVEPTDRTALPEETEMTERQREALEAAYRAGYFDWPRESTAEDVAESLDITAPTLHGHLRKGEHQLLEAFFET